MDLVSYVLAKKYVNDTANALGAVKGAPCTVKKIVETETGSVITLEWTGSDGATETEDVILKNGIQGKDGITPNIQIGIVTTLEAGAEATATITGTIEKPILNLGIPTLSGKGADVAIDDTLSKSGKAADAKAVGDKFGEVSKAIAEQGKTIPKVFDWANAELPFTESEISDTVTGAGFVVNPTNYADGKTYFRYHAGATSFKWTNPNPQRGALTITMRGYAQYSSSLSTKIVTVYTDGTDNSLTNMMYLKHGETVTYTTDPDKTVDYIRGNYDFENWVLLDVSVLSFVADYPAPTGTVKSVNGNLPDENGNVEINLSESGSGGGMSTTAKNLLITILRNGVYTSDQSANINALETALGESGGTDDTDTVTQIGSILRMVGGVTVTQSGTTLNVA